MTFFALPFIAIIEIGCGSDTQTPIRMDVAIPSNPVPKKAVIYFYAPEASCKQVELQAPRGESQIRQEVALSGTENNITAPNQAIPAGSYTLLVDVEDETEKILASGCAENQEFKEGALTPIEIVFLRPESP